MGSQNDKDGNNPDGRKRMGSPLIAGGCGIAQGDAGRLFYLLFSVDEDGHQVPPINAGGCSIANLTSTFTDFASENDHRANVAVVCGDSLNYRRTQSIRLAARPAGQLDRILHEG